MKPVAFDYERPADLASAAALARREDTMVKFIAGGQSLGPMLNLRLVQPDLLVDLTGLAELKRVEVTAEALIVGACVTHADIEDGRVPEIGGGVLRALAAGIAYRAVRNRGTIGGSICHADPAADWVACLCALGASVVITDGSQRRVVAIWLRRSAFRVCRPARAGAFTRCAARPASSARQSAPSCMIPYARCAAP